MKRIVKYGLITLSILIIGLIVTFGIFISTFDLFGKPEKEILKTDCDYEGLRQATIFEYGGNAVTNPAILVSIDLGCSGYPDDSKKEIVFSAEHADGSTVDTEWKSFDTLKIIYSGRIEPIIQLDKVTYSDSTLNVSIEYVERNKLNAPQNSPKLTDILTADFNGDGNIDQAKFTRDNETSGIIIKHGHTNEEKSFGLGKSFAHMTNFNWVDFWGVINDSVTYEIVVENGEIIGDRKVEL